MTSPARPTWTAYRLSTDGNRMPDSSREPQGNGGAFWPTIKDTRRFDSGKLVTNGTAYNCILFPVSTPKAAGPNPPKRYKLRVKADDGSWADSGIYPELASKAGVPYLKVEARLGSYTIPFLIFRNDTPDHDNQ